MTSLAITTARNQLQTKTTGVYGKSTAPFLSCLMKKLVDMLGDPMNTAECQCGD